MAEIKIEKVQPVERRVGKKFWEKMPKVVEKKDTFKHVTVKDNINPFPK